MIAAWALMRKSVSSASLGLPGVVRASSQSKSKDHMGRRCIQSSITTSFLLGLLLSFTSVVVKIGVARIPVLQFIAMSASGSWILSTIISLCHAALFPSAASSMFGPVRNWVRLALQGLAYSGATVLLYSSIELLALVEAISLFYLFPLLGAILASVFYDAPFGITSLTGMIICVVGAALVAVPLSALGRRSNPWDAWGPDRNLGILMGLGAAILETLGMFVSGERWDSKLRSEELSNPIAATVWSFQIQILMTLPLVVLNWPEDFIPLDQLEKGECWLVLGFVVCSTICRMLECWVTQRKSKSFVRVLEAIHIFWAAVWAVFFLTEFPPVLAAVGGGVLIVGISILSMEPQHKEDDMEDWDLADDPGSEYTLYTEGTMLQVDGNWTLQ